MKKSLKILFGGILCFLVVLTNAAIPYRTDALFAVPAGQVFAENNVGNINYKISGYVEPDFNFDNPDLKSGFLVELVGYEKSVLSDSRGYFEIKDVPSNSSGYTVKISKANYLYRQIEDVELTCNIQLGTEKEPIKMWAGDIQIDGIQDNAINIVDIMQVISCFNTTPEYEDYNADLDINKNGAINLEDIMIVVGHFNTTPLDYPSVPVTKENDREFIFRIKTTSEGEVYQFPIKSSEENYNIVVDWGDGTTSEITGYSTREHKYESAGTYTIKVISFDYMPLYFNSDKKLIEVVTPFPDIGETSFRECFYICENLTKIPDGLFDNNINATSFGDCFYGCSSLKEIPKGLFDNNINAINFWSCFDGCSSLTEIPEGLFDNNINATYFSYCFYGCVNLTKIPDGLFDNNINATYFYRSFSDCVNLTGLAPDLWTRSNVYGDNCFMGCTNLSNYADIPNSWK
jgi:hypothetical protein